MFPDDILDALGQAGPFLGQGVDVDKLPANTLLECLDCPAPSEVKIQDSWVSELLADLVIMCGLDSQSTTAEQMDKRHARFVCDTCSVEGEKMTILSWRAAVSPAIASHLQYMCSGYLDIPGFRRCPAALQKENSYFRPFVLVHRTSASRYVFSRGVLLPSLAAQVRGFRGTCPCRGSPSEGECSRPERGIICLALYALHG